jgi:hypothetical protein
MSCALAGFDFDLRQLRDVKLYIPHIPTYIFSFDETVAICPTHVVLVNPGGRRYDADAERSPWQLGPIPASLDSLATELSDEHQCHP